MLVKSLVTEKLTNKKTHQNLTKNKTHELPTGFAEVHY